MRRRATDQMCRTSPLSSPKRRSTVASPTPRRCASPDAARRGARAPHRHGRASEVEDAHLLLVVEGRRRHHRGGHGARAPGRRPRGRRGPARRSRWRRAGRARASPTRAARGWPGGSPPESGAPVDALGRLEVACRPRLGLLTRGEGPLADGGRADVLAALLAADPRQVVVDCGTAPDGAARTVAAAADRSVLVTRACFLALRRAVSSPLRPTEVVLVAEPSRSLTRHDVESRAGRAGGRGGRARPRGRPSRRRRAARHPPPPGPRTGAARCRVRAAPSSTRCTPRLLGADPARVGDARAVAATVRARPPAARRR